MRLLRFGKAPGRTPAGRASATTEGAGPAGSPDWRRLAIPPRLASFTDFLPYMEYTGATGTFLLEDGRSVAAAYEITPIGTEGRTEVFRAELQQAALDILTQTIPEIPGNPWVLQVFVTDDHDFDDFLDDLAGYGRPEARDTPFANAFTADLAAHIRRVSRARGGFTEGTRIWRGNRRRVRLVLYRRRRGDRLAAQTAPDDELNDVAHRLELALANAGVGWRRLTGADVYRWLLCFFSPRPAVTGGDPAALLRIAPWPGDDDAPFGRDLAEMLLAAPPTVDTDGGVITLDGCPHALVTTQGLRRRPDPGHFTGEQNRGDQVFALFDRMPEGATLAMAITFQPQDLIASHVGRIEAAAVGSQIEAMLAGEEAALVKRKMGFGDKLYPVEIGVYVRAETLAQLRERRSQVASELIGARIGAILGGEELLHIDRWLAMLPMNYRPEWPCRTRRARLTFSRHLAALFPVFGRCRGTGHPGLLFWNRGAEPLAFDPLHPEDRKKNAHMLIFGPTGAGKSALLVYLILMLIATYRPRLYIVEAGNSFGLLGDHLARHGLAVHRVALKPGASVSLAPFADARHLQGRPALAEDLDGDDPDTGPGAAAAPADPTGGRGDDDADVDDDVADDTVGRDILGELELAARIMITGGDAGEEQRLTRSDRLAIRTAILDAADRIAAGDPDATVLPADVAAALRARAGDAGLTDGRRDRLAEMADAMALFCEPSSLAGQLFNRPGAGWPDADVTIVDVATLARGGYEGELALAYVSLIGRINDVIERRQHDARHTIVITDEGHLITTNPLLSRYVVKITKMWRKLGAWFWLATQNLDDFPSEARRMLNMMEWWILLVMPKEEVDQVSRFKEISPEVRQLLLACRKEARKFVEGVVLTDAIQTIFRNVPPPLALALAMTEKEEKAWRLRLMQELGLPSELDAAYHIARILEDEAVAEGDTRDPGVP